MSGLEFTKMQGLGNDFVIVDGPCSFDRSRIEAMCDRRFGIGADGILVVSPGDPVSMEYWNADGSAAEMCGNGLRCVARYAYDRGMVDSKEFVVETPIGPRRVEVGNGAIRVDLGPVKETGETDIDGRRYHLVSVGNPHAVTFVDDPKDVAISEIGPLVESDPRFPDGTNVEFVSIVGSEIEMRVWERGVGETMACGTGMAAAAMVASREMSLDGAIRVNVPGGAATVELKDDRAWLTGPAQYSFRGVV